MIPGDGGDLSRGGRGRDFSGTNSAGSDTWHGGPGSDHLTDFRGTDQVFGGPAGDACLVTRDGEGGDSISGGPGRDTGQGDARDGLSSLEVREFACFAE